jgi:putative transposase
MERLCRSVKYENVCLNAYETGSELRRGLAEYFEFHNAQRSHQALDYRRPDDVYYGRPALKATA